MLTSSQYTKLNMQKKQPYAAKLKNNNKCAQQRNIHHGVEGEIIEGPQRRENDKRNV